MIKQAKQKKMNIKMESDDIPFDKQSDKLEATNRKLTQEIKDLEKDKDQDFNNFKMQLATAESNISKQQLENKVLNIHFKEKDQELKLTELKIKELHKRIPHQRLNKMSFGN